MQKIAREMNVAETAFLPLPKMPTINFAGLHQQLKLSFAVMPLSLHCIFYMRMAAER